MSLERIRRKGLVCTAIAAVAAISLLGAEADGGVGGVGSVFSRIAETLNRSGEQLAAASSTDRAKTSGQRATAATVGGEDRTGVRPAGTDDGASDQAQAWRRKMEAARLSPLTPEMQLSSLHGQSGVITDPAQIAPQIDPALIRLATDYNNPLQPGQEVFPRPSRRFEEGASAASGSIEGAPGADGSATSQAESECGDPTQFVSVDGDELVSRVKAYGLRCYNMLTGLSDSDTSATFAESKMVAVANAMAAEAVNYDGTNSSGILGLMRFLNTGYFVKFQGRPVGPYGQETTNALRAALDAFSAGASFALVNNEHGEILSQYLNLIEASDQTVYKIGVYKDLYARYSISWRQYEWMSWAVDATFLALWRAHTDEKNALVSMIQSDTSIISALRSFANRNFANLYNEDYYKVENAAREMARFLQYSGAAKSEASSGIKELVAKSSPAVGSPTAGIWVGVAQFVSWFDAANCSAYVTCNMKERLMAEVLPSTHVCSPTLKIRAQSMLAAELEATCSELMGQESFFHGKLYTRNVPVAGDNNTSLELVVFNDYRAYTTYAGAMFSIDTRNGGIYIEGNPSAAGNQARFFAHEAQWEKPKFSIWNLNHEYVHYLDGRFDRYGDYGLSVKYKTVWWIEGLAEYISHEYMKTGSPKAIAEAKLATYPVSTIFQNDYASGNNRVYSWGYLAARYMFERQRGSVTSILSYFRPGDYAGYAVLMDGIRTNANYDYDYDFRWWLGCVADVTASRCAGNKAPVADFKSIDSGLTVQFMDYSTDVDGHIASQSWSFSDGTSASGPMPIKRFALPGSYSVTLTVVDDNGMAQSKTQSITVAELPTCADPDVRRMRQDCKRTVATNPSAAYFYVTVPKGVKQLRITLADGTGDVDLFAMAPLSTTWAGPSAYTHRSTNQGNGESILIDRPMPGDVALMVRNSASVAAMGATITSQFVMN
ncbi:collagenase [Lysobacter firmicutimachus]|uniref:microbial collagenase n=1 Tax=Lysobacter firmicutimachus TaxID=1792846 RepID=A0AAU8MV08_9GAMM